MSAPATVVVLSGDHLREFMDLQANRIRKLAQNVGDGIVEIGESLHEARRRLPRGEWQKWLKKEFRWSDEHARRFITVYLMVKERRNSTKLWGLQIDASALYLLAKPSTPTTARDHAFRMIEQGTAVTHKTAQAIIAESRPQALPQPVRAPVIRPAPLTPAQIRAQERRDQKALERFERERRLLTCSAHLHTALSFLSEINISPSDLVEAMGAEAQKLVDEILERLPVSIALLVDLRSELQAAGYLKRNTVQPKRSIVATCAKEGRR